MKVYLENNTSLVDHLETSHILYSFTKLYVTYRKHLLACVVCILVPCSATRGSQLLALHFESKLSIGYFFYIRCLFNLKALPSVFIYEFSSSHLIIKWNIDIAFFTIRFLLLFINIYFEGARRYRRKKFN